MSQQGIRRPIYLSPTKDADILRYVGPLEEKYSFSAIVKELMRDGIKFRTRPTEKFITQSHTSLPVNIQLSKKEVTDEEIEDKLDDF